MASNEKSEEITGSSVAGDKFGDGCEEQLNPSVLQLSENSAAEEADLSDDSYHSVAKADGFDDSDHSVAEADGSDNSDLSVAEADGSDDSDLSSAEADGSDDNVRSAAEADGSDHYVMEGMKILVENPSGKTICLEVDSSDTIEDIKARIQDEKLLLFNGQHLEDSKTLADYHIKGNSTLYLHFGLQILVNMHDGETITLEVESFDTVKNVKAKILEMKEIPLISQRLIYAGKQLKDKCILAGLSVQNKSTMYLKLHSGLHPCLSLKDKSDDSDHSSTEVDSSDDDDMQGMQIFVETSSGKTIRLQVKRTDTIKDIKAKIQDEKLLFFDGKQLEDGKTLADYHIKGNCSIRLHFGLQIFVHLPYWETVSLEVESFDTLENVKAKIFEMKGIPPIRQRFILAGKYIDDKCTLADCSVQNNSALDLKLLPSLDMRITVETLTGKTVILEGLRSSDTVWSLKHKFYEKEFTPPHRQKLTYAERVLEDTQTLAYYDIQNQCLLRFTKLR